MKNEIADRIKRFLSKPKNQVILNFVLISLAVLGNIFNQAFCIPSLWASILIIICFLNSIFLPLLVRKNYYFGIPSLISGISLCLFIYCIIFLAEMNFFGIILIVAFGLGLLAYIPHYFAIQIIYFALYKKGIKFRKRYFGFGILLSLTLFAYSNFIYIESIRDINTFKSSNFKNIEKTFMNEKILGTGIVYHTEICIYDGWRPPIHEPILNMGMWLNKNKYPLKDIITLKERKELYQKFFPENPIKKKCSCAVEYKNMYHNDSLFK